MAEASRYRALLDVSSAIAEQPTLEAILQSLRGLLSNIANFEAADLYLLNSDATKLRLYACDRSTDLPPIPVGTELVVKGTITEGIIEGQEPVFIPDSAAAVAAIPELAHLADKVGARCGYVFPISTARKRFGLLAFTKPKDNGFAPEDVELMRSISFHVAVALESALATAESALATARAEDYQRELARERDRLRLLLEINNHIVSKLDVHELCLAASRSIRTYFANDFTLFSVLDQESDQLRSVLLDFPGSKGALGEITSPQLAAAHAEKIRRREPGLESGEDFGKLPPNVADALKTEGIKSLAIAPLAAGSRPLGVLVMGSRKADAFKQEDLDLLVQIGIQISLALQNALTYTQLQSSATRLEEERLYLESEIRSEYNFEDIVGKSVALRKVLDQIAIVAPTPSTVLLHGETGTGKELVARAIHNLSPRRERTFVRLNCAAIPSGLVESELFGHEKGAFTGALMQKRGRLELADRGSLFLDEIGDITIDLQPKLLRVLQEQEFERLGSTKTIHVDVRLIAATHRDLREMIRNNQFREDLYYRLAVFPIEVPPLRERREDIHLLVHYFVSNVSRRMQRRIRSIPKDAMEALVAADWPGNIRELQNFIERCVILTQGDELNVPLTELKKSARNVVAGNSTFQQAERQVIIDALRGAGGKVSGKGGAAERLGLKRTTLQNKMRKLKINPPDYGA